MISKARPLTLRQAQGDNAPSSSGRFHRQPVPPRHAVHASPICIATIVALVVGGFATRFAVIYFGIRRPRLAV